MKENKRVGMIGEDKEKGLRYVGECIGVICGVRGRRNRRCRSILKGMIGIKRGNGIILGFDGSGEE
ncbi:hypothetical protein, partial [Staphylococcus epidermidis]|uniref:hypothetical protein n=1 Tax=Staphylococcus epidermidis TaxID=1282 RepID=UPI001642416F